MDRLFLTIAMAMYLQLTGVDGQNKIKPICNHDCGVITKVVDLFGVYRFTVQYDCGDSKEITVSHNKPTAGGFFCG